MFRLKCDMVLDLIVDYARGVPLPESTASLVERHVEACATCGARLQRERGLSAGLKAVAGLTAGATPAIEMEQRLLGALAAMHTKAARTRTYSRVWRAAAAVLLVMTGLATWTASTVTPDPSPTDAARQPGSATGGRGAFDDFMPLPVASGLPVLESGVIVRIELPVSALPGYGVEVITDTPRNRVQADLLVGQDGQARAIRFITVDRSAVASRSRP